MIRLSHSKPAYYDRCHSSSVNRALFSGLTLIVFTCFAPHLSGTVNAASGYEDYSHIPHNRTFDVITWNIEWFGDETRGPDDIELQYRNVIEIIDSLQPDLIGVQEIYSNAQFDRLIDDLEHYEGFVTRYGWGGDPDAGMDAGFIYNTGTVVPTHHRLLDNHSQASLTPYYWASRLPLEFIFRVNLDGVSFSARAVVFHAKARSDKESYERRTDASREIKDNYFDPFFSNIPLIFMGDYNDRVIGSTYRSNDTTMPSPYQNFVEDTDYEVVTYSLDEAGEASWPGVGSSFPASMLDHITINEPWFGYWLEGSERVYRPDYIDNYLRTTSDHYPVKVRFDVTGSATATDHPGSGQQDHTQQHYPHKTQLLQNHPNPFNSQTTIPFELHEQRTVSIMVYNALGELVAEPVVNRQFNTGKHQVRVDASGWSSGIYLYRMNTGVGISDTGIMALIK